ncbi:uncharacterized protein LOC103703061 [Phoenix dactylifera]|uniref:Uncharacterized protein LOC103703061 n=1 Tax=Phoenix dactylifera TaxID=42345 RepID=A0A8B7BRQ1_PHODC|nr:uncharacterized protein LOC103703061 [Phoenix dactylifera]XP_026659759.2 uncharacterized protein LOC103703061 [Phoenix dactylifera]
MVLEEEQARYSSGSRGGGKKKNKQNKIPQRGLGVAQLEKLRIEEQQKNVASSSSSASQGMSLFPSQQPILPFLTAPNDPNPMLRPVVNPDPLLGHPETISTPASYFNNTLPQVLENSIAGSGNSGNGFLPMLWNTAEPSPLNAGALPRDFGFRTPPDAEWRSSGLLRRRQQQQVSPISVVNKALPPSSSGASLQMEPPSNQSYTSNYNLSSFWPEEERVVGMKRRWPFHLDGMPGHTSFPCKNPSFSSSHLKPNESMHDFIKSETKTTDFRGETSSSSICDIECKRFVDLDNSNKENGGAMDGGFLSLGLSPASCIPKLKQATLIQPPSVLDYPEFSFVPSQGSMSDAISSSQPPFYSFLPMGPNSCEKTLNEPRREALDGVDLNLKL